MYLTEKKYWEVETIVKRIRRMIYIVKESKLMLQRHLNQTKSRYTDEENNTLVDVAPKEVFFRHI